MSKFKFEVGDKVCKKAHSFGWDDIYIVVFNVKIAGKKFCGLLGPDGRTHETVGDVLEGFIRSVEKGLEYSVLLVPQKELQIYREPIYVQMARDQYSDLISSTGPVLEEGQNMIDLRGVATS